MKSILFVLLTALHFTGHAQQDTYQLKLSDSLNETRMGLWTIGDYKVFVDLNYFEKSFRNTSAGYLNGALNNNFEDSVINIYNLTHKRYLKAADQLKNAVNGFDLRSLVVYYGPEDEKQNAGNSFIVENMVQYLLENGQAAVYYKGARVFALKKQYGSTGYGVEFGYNILIYFDNVNNYAFNYYRHVGW